MPELALAHLRFWADSCEFAAAAFGKMSFYDPAEHLDHGAYVAFALTRTHNVDTFKLNKVRRGWGQKNVQDVCCRLFRGPALFLTRLDAPLKPPPLPPKKGRH